MNENENESSFSEKCLQNLKQKRRFHDVNWGHNLSNYRIKEVSQNKKII